MRLEAEEKHRLRDLFLTTQQKCEQVPVAFGPSKHRSTQIDTGHRVLQGTSDTPAALASLPCAKAKFPAGSSSKLAAAGARSGSADRPAHHKTTAATNPRGASASAAVSEPASCTLYQTDFSAGSGSSSSGSLKVLTHSPARLAAARRTLESSSEWAELDKLEVLRTQQEAVARQQALEQQHIQHRQHLDQQVAVYVRTQQAAVEEKAADLAAAVADVAAQAQEQAAKEAAARVAAEKVKREREQQVVASVAAKARAAAKKTREDAALLAAEERQVAAGKAAAAAKAAAARQAAEEARAANARAQQDKKRAAKEQQRRDEELMQETIRTLQRQEEAREAALVAFHESIAARALHAGAIAVAESKARQEREDRLIAASEAKAQAEAQAKHTKELAKQAAQAAERKATAAAAAAAKLAAQQAAIEEQAAVRAKVQADLAAHQRSEELSAQQRHERNLAHRKVLEQQIVQAEERALLDDVFMAPKECELNRRLISAARRALDSVSQRSSR